MRSASGDWHRSTDSTAGFTLIELLVVIAIIGILAAIILASLATAKNKGNDAAIEEEMAQLRSQAELYSGAVPSNYRATCSGVDPLFATANNGMGTVLSGISASIGGFTSTNSSCASSPLMPSAGGAWAVAIVLPSGTGIWCVDYTGASKLSSQTTVSTAINTSHSCN